LPIITAVLFCLSAAAAAVFMSRLGLILYALYSENNALCNTGLRFINGDNSVTKRNRQIVFKIRPILTVI